MGKILLIFPKLEPNKEYHYIPYSTLAVAASLEFYNIEFSIFDERVQQISELRDSLKDVTTVGITFFSGYQTTSAYNILKMIKEENPEIVTIAGGPHPTSLPDETLSCEYVDYVVVGHSETVIEKIIAIINNETEDENGKIISSDNVKAVFSANKLNSMESIWHPLPFHKINFEKYINPSTKRGIYISQYGCVGKCTFCATPHTRYFVQKPVSVVKMDIENMLNAYQLKVLWFADATLLTDRKRMNLLLKSLDEIDAFTDVRVAMDARADEIIRYSIDELKNLKNIGAGLDDLVIGLESGDSHIAENIMKKGRNHLKKFARAMEICAQLNIDVTSGLIFGVPGENPEHIRNTIEYIHKIREIHPNFRLSTTFFRPLPGTELFDSLKNHGFIKQNSLSEWAQIGYEAHYKYNTWMDIPWLPCAQYSAYRKAYDHFILEHHDILV